MINGNLLQTAQGFKRLRNSEISGKVLEEFPIFIDQSELRKLTRQL